MEYSKPAWLDDIKVVTQGARKEHEKKLFDVLKKLEDAGYRASETESEIFLNETKWFGHEIDQTGVKPNKEKVKEILDLKHPENQKQLKSFVGAIEYLAKFLPRQSEKTVKLRRFLKGVGMELGERTRHGFQEYKRNINRRTLLGTLCKGQRKYRYNRC